MRVGGRNKILDVQLLERVFIENFETVNVEQSNHEQIRRLVSRFEVDVDFRDEPVEHTFIECFGQRIT